jgi:hypothetical protein
MRILWRLLIASVLLAHVQCVPAGVERATADQHSAAASATANGPAASGNARADADAQPSRAPIRLGDRGELIVDGKRRFILAGYRSGQVDKFTDALPTAAEAGFDMVHDYRFETFDIAKLGAEEYVKEARTYLRRADQLGLGVFLGLPRVSVRAADEETLAKVITALSDERALWMWYIYDEPRPDTLSSEAASRVYNLLRRLDRQRPSIMLANSDSAVRQYSPSCDLMWRDRYPIAATSLQHSSLSPIAEALETAIKTVPAGKPVWPVLQVQDNKGSPNLRKRAPKLPRPDDRNHRPNEAELRAQAHIAIARKAMGVAYYWAPETWYSMKSDTPAAWAWLTLVLHELRSLEPVLLSSEAPHPVEVTGERDKVLTWTRVHDGRLYVGLVNVDINKPAHVVLDATDRGGAFEKVSGDGNLKPTGRGLDVRLGPAGVAVVATAQ